MPNQEISNLATEMRRDIKLYSEYTKGWGDEKRPIFSESTIANVSNILEQTIRKFNKTNSNPGKFELYVAGRDLSMLKFEIIHNLRTLTMGVTNDYVDIFTYDMEHKFRQTYDFASAPIEESIEWLIGQKESNE